MASHRMHNFPRQRDGHGAALAAICGLWQADPPRIACGWSD